MQVATSVCPECGGDRARGDRSGIVYCGECGQEWHPGDPGYPTDYHYAMTEAERAGKVSEESPAGFRCPSCGGEDVSSWAEDGESDDADHWKCEVCPAWGDLTRETLPNGDVIVSVWAAPREECEDPWLVYEPYTPEPRAQTRRVLIVHYDVTDLSEEEIAHLTGEAIVQAEESDRHPSVNAWSDLIEGEV